MQRLFDVSEGCFSFAAATYQTLEIRDKYIKTLQSEYESLEVIAILDKDRSILEQVLDYIKDKKTRAIFVTDIESLVVDDDTCLHLINGLNTSREAWKKNFCCPIIFWMPEYLTTIVSRVARDFWSWISHHFEFVEEGLPESVSSFENIRSDTIEANTELIKAMSLAYRKKRISELEKWLQNPTTDIKMQDILSRRINELADLYYYMAEYPKAEPLMRRALKIDEDSLGPDHPDVAIDMNNLAQLLADTNRLDEAEPLMRLALKIDEDSFGPDHPDVAIRLNNLAQLLKATNRLDEAEPLMRLALKIDEDSLGLDHPNVAIRLNNLAQLLKATNRLDEAEPLMRRGLEIEQNSKGKNHPHVAIQLNNLAQLLADTNRLDEAEPLMRRVLKIDEASFGPDHPNVAIRLNNLAQLLKATNRLDEAEPLYKRVVDIFEKSLGKDHPNVATALNNLAVLLQVTNRLSEAEPMYRRALKIDEASFGPDHPNVAIRLNNLAVLLQDTNRLAEAEPLMERQLVIFLQFTRRTGHQHPRLQDGINNYTKLLMQMGHSKDEVNNRLKRLAPEMFK